MIKFLIVLILNLNYITSQYYQPPPPPNDYDSSNNNKQPVKLDNIEQKYVNSGQSVLLVCDLPNSLPDGKVLFVKYDSKILGSEGDDDDRFETAQQYAWEWSLKINAINEDDAGIYYCKVGNIIIQQYEIIVRVPPRIKDDLNNNNNGLIYHHKILREGEGTQFSCFATGVPKPNITWYSISNEDQSLKLLPVQTGSYLTLENLTRYSPKKYQCKASNNIPPSDTRNFSILVEFAPEIEIQSKFDRFQNAIVLNCTIKAMPLTNKFFWRKDGNYIQENIKNEIRNVRLNEFTLIAQLIIKHYNELDFGLYECLAENDLRVSKLVYTLQESLEQEAVPTKLMPIGYANNYRTDENPMSTSTLKHRKGSKHQLNNNNNKKLNNEETLQKRPHQRNNQRNQTKLIDKILQSTTQETTNKYNSPFIIILEDEDTKEKNEDIKLKADINNLDSARANQNSQNSIYIFNFKILTILMFVVQILK